MYECVIFDKRFVDNTDELDSGAILRGSWKPSFQECILKGKISAFYWPLLNQPLNLLYLLCTAILSHIRSIDIDNKEDGRTLMQFLDALKSEFKVSVMRNPQCWIE